MCEKALFSVVYPDSLQYLSDWYRSVAAQTVDGFAVYVVLDDVPVSTAKSQLLQVEKGPKVTWISAPEGLTIAEVRQLGLSSLPSECQTLVLVDSDDILMPTRVERAVEALQAADLVGCALRLVDEDKRELLSTISLEESVGASDVFPSFNAYGMSNTAYRTQLLRACLPIDPRVRVVDWFLATRAWLLGARIHFDRRPCMYYRQHARNFTRVTPPFSKEQVERDASLVREHYAIVLESPPPGCRSDRLSQLRARAAAVERFVAHTLNDASRLKLYLQRLNALKRPSLWWTTVANPAAMHYQ